MLCKGWNVSWVAINFDRLHVAGFKYLSAVESAISNGGAPKANDRSIWRPLLGPVRDWPLAMLDHRSVDKACDMIAADVIYPHYVGESFNLFYNASHEWFYLSDQMPEEVLIFKSFDSMLGVAECRSIRAAVAKHRLIAQHSLPTRLIRSANR